MNKYIYIYIYIYVCIWFYRYIRFANDCGSQGSILGQVVLKTQKMVVGVSLLNTQHFKVRIKGKWSNPGKGVSPSLHLSVVAVEKGAFGSPSTIVGQLIYILNTYICIYVSVRIHTYIYIYIYIYIYVYFCYIYIYIYMHGYFNILYIYIYIYIYAFLCINIYKYVYIYK